MSLQTGGQQSDASDVLAAIFNHLGGPIELDELISTLAELLHISDQPVGPLIRMKMPSRLQQRPA